MAGVPSVSASSAMVTPALATDFLTREGSNLQRASRLFGVCVHSVENKDIDTTDVFLDHDGEAD